jgi:predicted ATPase/DNA-binding SARP family transcriptional activator
MTGEAHMRLELRVLGGFELRLDGQPLRHWPRAGARQLLKRLVVSERQAIRAEALAESLWPQDNSKRVMQRLYNLLYLLRKTLQPDGAFAPWLHNESGTVRLVTGETLWIDLVEFEHQLDAAALSEAGQGLLEHALSLYGGRLLGDEADDDWLAPRRAQLEGRFVAASQRLAVRQVQQGRLQGAIQTLNRLLAETPGHEPAHRELIILYGRLGRAEDVQRQFSECVAILRRELDVEPSAETCTAHREAQALSATARPAGENGEPQSAPHAAQTNNTGRWTAPHPVVALLGRDEAVHSALQQLHAGVRLLSLVGTGGIGKTQLAIRIAHEAQQAYPQGVCFVPLAEAQPGELYATIARALGLKLPRREEPKATVRRALEHSRMLLVVDNFEHMLGDAAELALLLQHCGGLALLATSRIRLNLAAETCVTVPPLSVDGKGDASPEALRLFIDCALRIHPQLTLDDDDAEEAIALTRCLEGLPLAIELAAARLPLFTLHELRRAVEAGSQVLAGGGADRPLRQRSLQHSFSWSYSLLDPNEQTLLLLLGLCDASFDHQDARGLAGARAADPELEFQRLIELGFVKRGRSTAGELAARGESRFEVPPAIREFVRHALQQHAEHAALQLRFIDHFVNSADRLDAALDSSDWKAAGEALLEFATQSPNFFAALNTAQRAEQPANVCRLVALLAKLWFHSGMWHEASHWIELAGEQVHALDPAHRARLMLSVGTYWSEYRCPDQAERAAALARQLAAQAGQPNEQVRALFLEGSSVWARNAPQAIALLRQAEPLMAQVDDLRLKAKVESTVGLFGLAQGDLEGARLIYESCHKKFKQSDHAHARMNRCANLAMLYSLLGRYGEANAFYEEALSPELIAAARPTRLALAHLRRTWMYCCQMDVSQAQQSLGLAREVMLRAKAEPMMPLLGFLEGQIAFLAGELPRAIAMLSPALDHASCNEEWDAYEASLWCFWAAKQAGRSDIAADALLVLCTSPFREVEHCPRVLEAASAWLLGLGHDEAAALATLQADHIRNEKSYARYPIDQAMSRETRMTLAQRLGTDWQARWQEKMPPTDVANPLAWLLDVVSKARAAVTAPTHNAPSEKDTGAENTTEPSRSSAPPCPSIIDPQSLTPRSRLIAEVTKPPKKPIRQLTKASGTAPHGRTA